MLDDLLSVLLAIVLVVIVCMIYAIIWTEGRARDRDQAEHLRQGFKKLTWNGSGHA